MEGWIKLHRKIKDCEIWETGEPFDRRSAWIDLLLMASHKDTRMMFDGNSIPLEAGSFITSKRKLADKWKWSVTKVTKYLSVLEENGMLVVKSNTKKTLVSIVNYRVYQYSDFEKSNTEKTLKEHRKNTEVTQKELINNVKNVNNDKNVKNSYIYSAVIDYLNEKAGTNYRKSTVATQKHINARISEGYTIDDFKKVIDCKVADWKFNPQMSKYLAPDTLFGTKFEKYLNQDVATQSSQCVMEGFAPDIDPKWFGGAGN